MYYINIYPYVDLEHANTYTNIITTNDWADTNKIHTSITEK